MAQLFKYSIIMGILSSCCLAQVTVPQVCSDLPVVQNFDIPRYLGLWYEIERYQTAFELGGICTTAEYGLNEDGTVSVHNSLILEATGFPVSINGTARVNSTDGSAKLAVSFPITGDDEAPYWVLDTDYETYSVVWACRPVDEGSSRQTAWFLSRVPTPSPGTRFKVYSVFAENDIDLELLDITKQHDCPARNQQEGQLQNLIY